MKRQTRLTQKAQPSIWVEKNNPLCLSMYNICVTTDLSLQWSQKSFFSWTTAQKVTVTFNPCCLCLCQCSQFYFFLQCFQSNGSSVILVASYGVPWALVMTCFMCPATNGSHVTLGWISLLKCFPHCTATQAEISGFKSNI